MAEDLAQEALAEALVSWPPDGVPRNPGAWLITVGRRRAIRLATDRSDPGLQSDLAVLAGETTDDLGAPG